MNNIMQRFIPVLCPILLWGCKYSRGDIYLSMAPGDSLQYVIAAKGSGDKILRKSSIMKFQHELKGNKCHLRYLSDSVLLKKQKGILLVNTSLPNIESDMLTKGYFGTLSSKQSVSYMVVSYNEFEQYFRKTEK